MDAWKVHFTERELKEIEYCKIYQRDFAHGTDGHNIRMIVAKLTQLLEGNLLVTEIVQPDSTKPLRKPAAFT